MEHTEAVIIGYSDYGDVYLKRVADRILLKRYHPLDYDYMDEYIRDNHDTLWDWQDAVAHWDTEQSYADRMSDYEYEYSDYFDYDSESDEYYDSYDGDYECLYYETVDRDKETVLERIMEDFNETFDDWGFHFVDGYNADSLNREFWEYFDNCVKYREYQEEEKKPHWKVFNYYK